MTAPASIPSLIAEGRRLIAAATPGPWKFERETFDGTKYAGGLLALFAESEDETGCWYRAVVPQRIKTGEEEFVQFGTPADAALVAFAVNNLAALLDVAEAAALTVYCDVCQADRRQPCHSTTTGEEAPYPHPERVVAALAAAKGGE